MISKYDSKCLISGKDIIAGETEIKKFLGSWVTKEYASKDALRSVINGRIEKAALRFGDKKNRKGTLYADMAREDGELVLRSLEMGLLGLVLIIQKLEKFEREQERYWNNLEDE